MPQGGIACAAHCEVELMKERSIQFVKSAAQWQSELSSWVLCRIEISCVWKVIRNCELKLNWPPQKHTILWLWCPVRKIIEYQWWATAFLVAASNDLLTGRWISVSGDAWREKHPLEKTNPCSIPPKYFFAATFYDIKTVTIKLAWDPIELPLRWPGLVTRVRHLWWLVPRVWIQNQPPIWFLSPQKLSEFHRLTLAVSPPGAQLR